MLRKLYPDWQETSELGKKIAVMNRRWMDIAKNGGGQSSDLLKADFGEDGPKGLDIKPWPDRRIDVKPIKTDPYYLNQGFFGRRKHLKEHTGAYVHYESSNEIYMQPRYLREWRMQLITARKELTGSSSFFNTTMFGHETTHIHQHTRNEQIPGLYSNNFAYVTFQDLPENTGFFDKLGTTLKRAHLDHMVGGRSVLTQIFSKEKGETIATYYALDNEIQARLHEILTIGYVEWDIMPATKTELWAAMHNLGVYTPPSILHELESSEDGKAALEKFHVHPSIAITAEPCVGTFNMIQEYLDSGALIEAVWNNHYPLLYGELLEFYGDVQGRARMDAGLNPRPVLEVISAVLESENALDSDQIKELSDTIPAGLAALYINNMIINDHHYPEEKIDDLQNVIEELLKRDDVKQALFEPKQLEAQAPHPIFGTMPLYNAIIHGRGVIAEMLLEAGAPLDQECAIINIHGKKMPAMCVENIPQIIRDQEAMLTDPSKVNRRARRNFYKPENLKTFADRLSDMKRVYAQVIDHKEKAPAIDYDNGPELFET